jgi:hypothetical protein
VRMPQPQSEPNLTFRISDVNEFHCSECGSAIAPTFDGRLVVTCAKTTLAVANKQENSTQDRRSFVSRGDP